MNFPIILCSAILLILSESNEVIIADSIESKLGAIVTIQATNRTVVPNISYTVDAVECLKEAISIYVDEESRADAYLQLFGAKHPGNWSVVVGYSSIITKYSVFIELLVNDKAKDVTLLKDDKKGTLYALFN